MPFGDPPVTRDVDACVMVGELGDGDVGGLKSSYLITEGLICKDKLKFLPN